MIYHPTVRAISVLLQKHGVQFDTFEHEPVRTSEEAARLRTGYTLAEGAKSIIVRVKEAGKGKHFVMLVVPGDKKFDVVKMKANLGFSDVRFATEEEVVAMTDGVLPGGIPPFGGLFDLDTFVDPTLFAHERVVFNAGDRSYSIAMRSADYRLIAQPVVADIVAP